MGLDTVELLVEVEKKFDISIPDKEAENIYTVADFADSVFAKIITKPTKNCLTQILFYKIKNGINQLSIENKNVNPDLQILDILPNNDLKNKWLQLGVILGLNLPELVRLDFDRTIEKEVKLFGIRLYSRTNPVTEGTVQQLIDWIVSENYKELLPIEKLSNKYEVERIICGIISDMMGIPINEIELNHSITDDLRIE